MGEGFSKKAKREKCKKENNRRGARKGGGERVVVVIAVGVIGVWGKGEAKGGCVRYFLDFTREFEGGGGGGDKGGRGGNEVKRV